MPVRRHSAAPPTPAAPAAGASTLSGGSVPNALQGFQQNRSQPVQIEAARLEVRDKDKIATFTGNVKVVQGDTTMRCKTLVVFYEQQNQGRPAGQAAPAMKAATPGPGGSSQISRLEAKGSVIVTQKDQTATGDTGLFDMKANTVTLLGNVAGQPGPERHARRAAGGRSDHRRVACRCRQSSGPVRMLIQQGPQAGQSGGAVRRARFGPQRSIELSGHRGRAVESLRPSDYHSCKADGTEPRSRTADVLDDLLTLFRRRRAPVRRRQPAAADSRWRINLATLGGLIGLGRPDRIPRAGPPMRRRRRYRGNRRSGSRRRHTRSSPSHTRSRNLTQNADWQAAQYAQHAEPRAPQRARRSDGASRQAQQPPTAAAAGRAAELSRRACGGKNLRRPQGGEGREPLRPPRRSGRIARTERRRQDHDLLHDHRADRGRQRPHRARRPRRHDAADVPARAARHRLSAAGGVDLPRPQCRGKHPRGAGGGRAEQEAPRARPRCAARGVQHHQAAQDRRRSRCPAASAAAARSRARWRRGRTTCCSTSRSPASTRSRSATFSSWCGT